MCSRQGQRGKYPYLLIVDEQVRTSFPSLRIAIKPFEIENVLFCKSVRALRQGGRRSVVQYYKRGSPRRPTQRVAIAVEPIRVIAISNNSFPVRHDALPDVINQGSTTGSCIEVITPPPRSASSRARSPAAPAPA